MDPIIKEALLALRSKHQAIIISIDTILDIPAIEPIGRISSIKPTTLTEMHRPPKTRGNDDIRIEILNKINALIRTGEKIDSACKAGGIAKPTYYLWSRKFKASNHQTTDNQDTELDDYNSHLHFDLSATIKKPDSTNPYPKLVRYIAKGNDPEGSAIIAIGKDTNITVNADKVEATLEKWRKRNQFWTDDQTHLESNIT